MAFPPNQLMKLNSLGAPSLTITEFINETNLQTASTWACDFCKRRLNSKHVCTSIEACRQCADGILGIRGAITNKKRLCSITIPITNADKHNLTYTMCSSEINPAHAVLDTSPELPSDLPKSVFLELQSSILEAFDSLKAKDQIFDLIKTSFLS